MSIRSVGYCVELSPINKCFLYKFTTSLLFQNILCPSPLIMEQHYLSRKKKNGKKIRLYYLNYRYFRFSITFIIGLNDRSLFPLSIQLTKSLV